MLDTRIRGLLTTSVIDTFFFNCLQIISGLHTLLAKCSEMEVRDAAVHFLGKCGRKEIPEHLKVGRTLQVHTHMVPFC